MSVLIETSLGSIVVDLFTDECPIACTNFLKLCKLGYYDKCIFHKVIANFIAQTGARSGNGGDSVYCLVNGTPSFFDDEIHTSIKHDKVGVLGMANMDKENTNASQFYITLAPRLESLDGRHTIFGIVAENSEGVLEILNDTLVNPTTERPCIDIVILATAILHDPFDDIPGMDRVVLPKLDTKDDTMVPSLPHDWVPLQDEKQIEHVKRERDAQSRAVTLEIVGDIPYADIEPPKNVLFIRGLDKLTQEEDLQLICQKYGDVSSVSIIRDHKTHESLCYAFAEFKTQEACERAYSKMDGIGIDGKRIHVDFSQSVAKQWAPYRPRKKLNTNRLDKSRTRTQQTM